MIVLKSAREIEILSRANQIVAEVLHGLRGLVKPGVTTGELDKFAEERLLALGARPAFKGYRGYPNALCTSVDEEIVHGIPSFERRLQEGSIIGLDLGAVLEGYYGDAAITVEVGQVAPAVAALVRTARECLERAIEVMVPGNRVTDISRAIQAHAEANGFTVNREFVGHGVGRRPHEDPQIPNYIDLRVRDRLKAGMVLAIEPMLNMGRPGVRIKPDRWTAVTEDGLPSAHFEHSVAIGEDGPVILSLCHGREP